MVTTSLSCGGITSFLIPLANFLSKEGHNVTLAYTKDEGNFLCRFRSNIKFLQYQSLSRKQCIKTWCKHLVFYDMARVRLRKNTQKPHYPSLQRLSYITAKYVNITDEDYDVAISTAEGFCNALVANNISAIKKIGWVHPDMGCIGLDVRAGRNLIDKLDYVVAVSESGCKSLKKFFPHAQSKIIYIENMMDCESIIERSSERVDDMPKLDGYTIIVTVCRITNDSKRIDRIIKVASILKDKDFKFRWYIIGDGPDFLLIKELISRYNLMDNVLMLGSKINPLPYIIRADCFVLTSQFEGKPVVVEEAKILHTPVIVTEYSSAKMQITSDKGVVVPNVDGVLEVEIAKLLMDSTLLNSLKHSCQSYQYDISHSAKLIKSMIE